MFTVWIVLPSSPPAKLKLLLTVTDAKKTDQIALNHLKCNGALGELVHKAALGGFDLNQ